RVGEPADVPSQAVHGGLGRESGPRARLVEGGDQRLFPKQVAVAPVTGEMLQLLAHLEHPEVLVSLELLERKDVPTQTAPHFPFPSFSCRIAPVNRTA